MFAIKTCISQCIVPILLFLRSLMSTYGLWYSNQPILEHSPSALRPQRDKGQLGPLISVCMLSISLQHPLPSPPLPIWAILSPTIPPLPACMLHACSSPTSGSVLLVSEMSSYPLLTRVIQVPTLWLLYNWRRIQTNNSDSLEDSNISASPPSSSSSLLSLSPCARVCDSIYQQPYVR